MKTTKDKCKVKLVLPVPYFLWMIGMPSGITLPKTVPHELQVEQENINRENVNHEEEK